MIFINFFFSFNFECYFILFCMRNTISGSTRRSWDELYPIGGGTHIRSGRRQKRKKLPNSFAPSLSRVGGPRFSSVLQILQRLKSSPALEHSHLSIPDSIASPHWISFLNRRSSHHGCRKRTYHHEGGSDVVEFGN